MGPSYLSALAAGAGLAFASSAHCTLMCGPLAVAVGARQDGGARLYVAGRVAGYAALGALSSGVAHALFQTDLGRWAEAAVSWLLGATLLAGALRPLFPRFRRVQRPLQLGQKRSARPLSRLLALLAHDPLVLGVASALLPCGALFAAVLAAASFASPALGAVLMASFACVSSLALVGVAQLTAKARRFGSRATALTSLALLLGAAVMLFRPWAALRTDSREPVPACHAAEKEAP